MSAKAPIALALSAPACANFVPLASAKPISVGVGSDDRQAHNDYVSDILKRRGLMLGKTLFVGGNGVGNGHH